MGWVRIGWCGLLGLALGLSSCGGDDLSATGDPCVVIAGAGCSSGPGMAGCQAGRFVVANLALVSDCGAAWTRLTSCYDATNWSCVDGEATPAGCTTENEQMVRCLAVGMESFDGICEKKQGCPNDPPIAECEIALAASLVKTGILQGCASEEQTLYRCEARATDWKCDADGKSVSAKTCVTPVTALKACVERQVRTQN